MSTKSFLIFFLILTATLSTYAQTPSDSLRTYREYLDSLYIVQTEDHQEPDKVLHAEPLYIDLIRDLGARKGEKEWNLGLGLTDKLKYDEYLALVEYEWAPLNRLGLELELPFIIHTNNGSSESRSERPGSRLEALKAAAQWTFLVSNRYKTSAALGYINQLEMNEFRSIRSQRTITGNIYNPFVVVARRWGSNFHTLIYTGPRIEQHFGSSHLNYQYEINTNLHFMIPGTRNFVGVEMNKQVMKNDFDMVIRPQMRVTIFDNLLIGIVAGIPIQRENERLSSFIRLIWEPGHSH